MNETRLANKKKRRWKKVLGRGVNSGHAYITCHALLYNHGSSGPGAFSFAVFASTDSFDFASTPRVPFSVSALSVSTSMFAFEFVLGVEDVEVFVAASLEAEVDDLADVGFAEEFGFLEFDDDGDFALLAFPFFPVGLS